jgi:hypothetical protein
MKVAVGNGTGMIGGCERGLQRKDEVQQGAAAAAESRIPMPTQGAHEARPARPFDNLYIYNHFKNIS